MDNLCHSLVGAGLAATGLRRLTPLAASTMVIGANFPDIDAVAMLVGRDLELRRGITHGLPAHVVLPFVLTALAMLWDRYVRLRRDPSAQPVRVSMLLLLATISIWTHSLLDHMNTYGVRWLMPFSDRWFYGDVLFIIDIWMWLGLGAAVVLARMLRGRGNEQRGARWARVFVSGVAVYVLLMAAVSLAGRAVVQRELSALDVPHDAHLMVAPVPVNPFLRDIVFERAGGYHFATLRWTPYPVVAVQEVTLSAGLDDPLVKRAIAGSREARAFMSWSRFPFASLERQGAATTIHLDDARYAGAGGRSFARTSVTLTP